MRLNSMFDPYVETGYFGFSLRAAAHRQPDATYRPSLEIRDHRFGDGELLYDCSFDELYTEADPAIERAMGRGHQVIDDLLNLMDADVRVMPLAGGAACRDPAATF